MTYSHARPSWLNSALSTLLSRHAQIQTSSLLFSRETNHSWIYRLSHRTPFPSLPIRGFHRKIPHKISRIGME
ncbi:hypothetical protein HMPREF0239_00274 [Clostridium sp. ATCC BAA-442]|nr:hypothetical protein HMPREF0239_00274 [Clostridium sp. ATCC BAA-442]